MFGKKKRAITDFNEKVKLAKYERLYRTMKEVLKVEVKAPGKEEIDYAATCSAIKTKARMAIDFIADLEDSEEKN